MNIFQVLHLQNIDLLFVGITIAAITILGLIVFLNNRQSITNQSFLFFAFLTVAYGSFNYISYQVTDPGLILWFLRLTIFFATWHAFSFFQLAYVFPAEKKQVSKKYKLVLLVLVGITSLLTLTPFVFSGIEIAGIEGQASQAKHEPGIALFGLTTLLLVLSGIVLLITKTIKAKGIEKSQFQIISAGTFITFAFLITFNLILPAAFKNVSLLPLAPIFFLPFILSTTYAILRYGLLNIKIIATEILTFVLAIVTLVEIVLSKELGALVFRISVFLLVLGFGILLIRSVRNEIEQREKLESLTEKLEVANRELKRLDAAKSEFVSIASHQLRTPLTAIKGYISLVLESTYGVINKKLQRPLKNVYDSNERLIRLVNDLLSLSRIESGKMELKIEETDLEEMIQSVLDELTIKAEQKNLQLILKKAAQPFVPVFVDSEKIRNVILNLVDNSIRYTKEGSITVSTTQKDGKLLLTVQDTGVGMTKDEINKIFESFSRGQAGVRFSTEGAGLGLYIAKQFVQMHKGKIWAESLGKGKGSTFHIELPVR